MSKDNILKFMSESSTHITNINRTFKNIKSDIIADFVYIDYYKLIITTDKVASLSDLNTIKKYIKNVNNIVLKDIIFLCFPQSKSYLKIISITYLMENTNVPINSNIVESVIKFIHIFNDIVLASKPRVIKVLSKSDMEIIWIDI